MKAQFTVKSLVAALTMARKGATVVTDTMREGTIRKSWLEKDEHQFGADHVCFRIVNGECTLYTQTLSKNREGDTCTFVRVECEAMDDGLFSVPIRVIHDYAKTFAPSDKLMITTETADYEWTDYHVESRNRAPEVKIRPETRLTITCGRNKCTIVGREAPPAFAWFTAPEFVKDELVKPIKVSYMHGRKPVVENVAPAPAMHGPAYVPPLGNPPGYILHDNRELANAAAIWQAYQYMLSLHANYAITDADGNVIAPLGPVQTAPTPIYTPAIGDSVFVVVNHENGTTTDRVIDVTRVMPDGKGFRGHDRRYGRTRNFYTAQLAVIRKWDGLEVFDSNGNVVIAAA